MEYTMNQVTEGTKFLVATADYLMRSRPDLYKDGATTRHTLVEYLETLDEAEGMSFVSFGSHILVKLVDDGVTEYYLTNKVASFSKFDEEGTAYAVSHDLDVDLPAIDSDLGLW